MVVVVGVAAGLWTIWLRPLRPPGSPPLHGPPREPSQTASTLPLAQPVLLELARIEPPRYAPPGLRGAEEGAARLFKAADPEARRAAEHAIRIKETILGPEHPAVAKSLIGDLAGAKELFAQALAVHEKALGPDSLSVAQDLSDLAVACWQLKEYEQARRLHERALAIRERRLGAEHFLVAASLNNLSLVVQEMGDLRGAPFNWRGHGRWS